MIIHLVSPAGGSGTSSIAFNLTHLLQELGNQATLLQIDPLNQLALQMGQDQPARKGLAHCLLENTPLQNHLIHNPQGIGAIGFGETDTHQRNQLHQLLLSQPKCLDECLTNNFGHIPNNTQPTAQLKTQNTKPPLFIIDPPRWPNPWCDQLLHLADLNLVVLTPDSRSLLASTLMLKQLQQARGTSFFLINQFNPAHILHLDIWTLAKTRFSHRLLPFYLHQDQALPESSAIGTTLKQHAPNSRLTDDLQKLANWLTLELE